MKIIKIAWLLVAAVAVVLLLPAWDCTLYDCLGYYTHTQHNRFMALWNLSGKTRVSRYQKNIHPLLSS